jgi:hypothetical protein
MEMNKRNINEKCKDRKERRYPTSNKKFWE